MARQAEIRRSSSGEFNIGTGPVLISGRSIPEGETITRIWWTFWFHANLASEAMQVTRFTYGIFPVADFTAPPPLSPIDQQDAANWLWWEVPTWHTEYVVQDGAVVVEGWSSASGERETKGQRQSIFTGQPTRWALIADWNGNIPNMSGRWGAVFISLLPS